MQINPAEMSTLTGFSKKNNPEIERNFEKRLPGGKNKSEGVQRQDVLKGQEVGRTFGDEQEVIRAIEHANTSLEGVFTQFEFSIHEQTREIMVKIIDRESGDVIREIPPEHILDMVAKMWELAGILVDERI